jgi:hypothetical protein
MEQDDDDDDGVEADDDGVEGVSLGSSRTPPTKAVGKCCCWTYPTLK